MTNSVLLKEEGSAEKDTLYTAKAKVFEGYEATAEDAPVLIEEGMNPTYLAYMPVKVDLDVMTVQQLKAYLDFKKIKYGSKDTKETLLALAKEG